MKKLCKKKEKSSKKIYKIGKKQEKVTEFFAGFIFSCILSGTVVCFFPVKRKEKFV